MTSYQKAPRRATWESRWTQFGFLRNSSTYSRGIKLYNQDTPVRDIFFVASGLVKFVYTYGGSKTSILGLGYPGWILGGEAAILGQRHFTTAETISDCELYRADTKEFQTELQRDHQFSFTVQKMQVLECRIQNGRLAALMTLSAEERFLQFLSELRLMNPTSNSTEDWVDQIQRLPLRLWELASILGVTAPYLSRLIARLRNQRGAILPNDSASIPRAATPVSVQAPVTAETYEDSIHAETIRNERFWLSQNHNEE